MRKQSGIKDEQFPSYMKPYNFGKSGRVAIKAPEKIKEYLLQHGKIDRHKIVELTGTANPTEVIKNLRDKHGMEIVSKRKDVRVTWWELR